MYEDVKYGKQLISDIKVVRFHQVENARCRGDVLQATLLKKKKTSMKKD